MGHLRLGRLPKSRKWSQVIDLLDATPTEPAKIACAVVDAADHRLRLLSSDPSLGFCFWLLTRVTWAARQPDFGDALRELGISVADDASALGFIALISNTAQRETSRHIESGPFGELASLALRRALTETVGESTPSLFGSSVEDLRRSCRAYSKRNQFGILSRRFFADFLARTLRYFVSKELSNHIGSGLGLEDVHNSSDFTKSLDLYARQSARIVEEFASGWYSKHNWESKGEISLEEAQGFVAIALRKLRMELKQERF